MKPTVQAQIYHTLVGLLHVSAYLDIIPDMPKHAAHLLPSDMYSTYFGACNEN